MGFEKDRLEMKGCVECGPLLSEERHLNDSQTVLAR